MLRFYRRRSSKLVTLDCGLWFIALLISIYGLGSRFVFLRALVLAAEIIHQFPGFVTTLNRTIELREGIYQFQQFLIRLGHAVIESGIGYYRVHSIFHSFCRISSAQADFAGREIPAAVFHLKRNANAFEPPVTLYFPDCLKGLTGETCRIRLCGLIFRHWNDG